MPFWRDVCQFQARLATFRADLARRVGSYTTRCAIEATFGVVKGHKLGIISLWKHYRPLRESANIKEGLHLPNHRIDT